MTPRLAIVGTGRSGSGYIAAVLNAAGVRCGHESYWTPVFDPEDGLEADSSWCAVPHLSVGAVAIVHQVRHPLLTIASLTENPDHGPFIGCRELVMGPLHPDRLTRAVETYLWWNLACERLTSFRYQVEEVDADVVLAVAALADLDAPRAEAAVAATPPTVNDHATSLRLTFDDIPTTYRAAVEHMAARYGYTHLPPTPGGQP